MITPLDIQNKEFKKSFRGYREPEVDQFLDNIIDDQIKYYNNLEKTLKDTLIVAQSTADEVVSSARQKAEVIIDDAEMTSKKLIDAADDDVRNIRKKYEYLKKEIFIFKTRYKSFIEAQLITLDEFYSEIESKDINMEEYKNSDDYIEETKEVDLKSEYIDLDKNIDDLGA